ncbi:FAD-dependent oxidoreductase [Saccharopolyspora rosea]|uniref:FAD-dependent oxidoreductase n=1 Tax=Saccharopolyspora rosea TaxID=524884 RepID=A0ABW3FVS8_9PSEU|nr:FAD-dependent oxidoreductase [Saccharopolyspora rosea]
MSRIVVAGGGPAAHRLVERLRTFGHSGPITVLGQEDFPAYNRVLLGAVLTGALRPDDVELPAAQADVRVGVSVTAIDRHRRVVRTDSGEQLPYDVLVLAVGARPVLPDVPGAERMLPVRTLADCRAVSGRVVVLGGGVLGVETACSLRARGADVALVHRRAHLMNRHLDAPAGRVLAERLRELGIRLRLGRDAAELRPAGLVLDDGEVLAADRVLVCAGVVPETGLAADAGLPVRRGVVVDDRLRTTDPRIHAIGDCAEHDGQVPGLLGAAWEQADVLARVLTGGDARYRGARTVVRPRGVEVASIGPVERLADPDAEVVRLSDPARGRYAALALRDERVAAAVLVGLPEAAAAVARLHDRDQPAQTDRLALLLGTPVAPRGAVELPADQVVCRCGHVTRQSLVAAWRAGARTVAALARATRATTGCGGCTDDVARLCASLTDDEEQEGAA